MLNIVSLLIGLVSLVLVAIAFFPLLGWANWLILPLPISARASDSCPTAARRGVTSA